MIKRRLACSAAITACLILSACNTDAVNKDSKRTFLTPEDLVKMTDQMARSITADPYVAAVTAQRPMVIVVKPIQNETSEVMMPGVKEMYLHRVRALLSEKQELRNRFTFVLNQEYYDRLRASEGMSVGQLGPTESAMQPEFALTGTFSSLSNVTNKARSDSYLCTFRLTKVAGEETRRIWWEGAYEVSRAMKKEFLD